MDFNLLKRLLPAEIIEYSTRQGVRSIDGRNPSEHRPYTVKRNVMNGNQLSCSVHLGDT